MIKSLSWHQYFNISYVNNKFHSIRTSVCLVPEGKKETRWRRRNIGDLRKSEGFSVSNSSFNFIVLCDLTKTPLSSTSRSDWPFVTRPGGSYIIRPLCLLCRTDPERESEVRSCPTISKSYERRHDPNKRRWSVFWVFWGVPNKSSLTLYLSELPYECEKLPSITGIKKS